MQHIDLQENDIGDAAADSIVESLLEQSVSARFPKVLLDRFMGTHCKLQFLWSLVEKGFRSFLRNDAPPALWPHALAKVSKYPSLTFHLLRQIPVSSNFGDNGLLK
jgi:hypothetical protein